MNRSVKVVFYTFKGSSVVDQERRESERDIVIIWSWNAAPSHSNGVHTFTVVSSNLAC